MPNQSEKELFKILLEKIAKIGGYKIYYRSDEEVHLAGDYGDIILTFDEQGNLKYAFVGS
jgi:hypothetical protein